jgi:Uma2 family endonuclease
MASKIMVSLQEFREQYADENGYEYWFGEAIRKVTSKLHGVVQTILVVAFHKAGYFSSPEVNFRATPDWEPKPDVYAERHPDHSRRYLTKAEGIIVAEIKSPTDTFNDIFRKCMLYDQAGVTTIFAFDPEEKMAWWWNKRTLNLELTDTLQLDNGAQIQVKEIWDEASRWMENTSN